ncbi:DUF6801 domain-containing protein [Streptomyces sp. NBC_00344]|uniref:DUF6801 domain-containing protein n=1 Tax=Streptomyces sp. NBC_00344 TaxID=2975720 RepID=UPI002E1D58E2
MRWAIGGRGIARIAALGLCALVAGFLPMGVSHAKDQQVKAELSYLCQFPSGAQRIDVEFIGSFPESGVAGQAIQPGEVTIGISLPQTVLGRLVPLDSDAVTGSATLTAGVSQGTDQAVAAWADLAAERTVIPESDDLAVEFAGQVPSVTVPAAGPVVFRAGALAFELAPIRSATPSPTASHGAPPAPPAPPAAAEPVRVKCSVAVEQDLTLARVPVSGESTLPVPSPSATAGGKNARPAPRDAIRVAPSPSATRTDCPPSPTGSLDVSRLPHPSPPPFEVPDLVPQPLCAYADGYTNVKKLGEAALVNDPYDDPGITNLLTGVRVTLDYTHGNIEADTVGDLKVAPGRSTFLAFGFMPTSAKMQFITDEPLTIYSTSRFQEPFDVPVVTTLGTHIGLRIYDVKVNGVPLDVGSKCRTSKPIDLVLRGTSDAQSGDVDGIPDYEIDTGGALFGKVDIPSFTGCGTGSDLDPIFTSAISGPDNEIKMIQGAPCFIGNPDKPGCSPIEVPKPQR